MAELRRFYQPVAINGNLTVSGTITDGSGVASSSLNDRTIITEVVDVNGTTVHAAASGIVTLWTAPAEAIVQRVMLNIGTVSTGACTLDIGYTSTTSTTTSDTFLDGINVAVPGLSDSMNAALDSGANAKAQVAASGKWITLDEASGDATGLVAKVYIQYILA